MPMVNFLSKSPSTSLLSLAKGLGRWPSKTGNFNNNYSTLAKQHRVTVAPIPTIGQKLTGAPPAPLGWCQRWTSGEQ